MGWWTSDTHPVHGFRCLACTGAGGRRPRIEREPSPWLEYAGRWGSTVEAPAQQEWFARAENPVSRSWLAQARAGS